VSYPLVFEDLELESWKSSHCVHPHPYIQYSTPCPIVAEDKRGGGVGGGGGEGGGGK